MFTPVKCKLCGNNLRLVINDTQSYKSQPSSDVAGKDLVAIGRIRQDISDLDSLELWLCGDQIRKGAALNAIQIAEILLRSQ